MANAPSNHADDSTSLFSDDFNPCDMPETYCGGVSLVIPTEMGDPVTALWLDQQGITIGTARGRLHGVRLNQRLANQVPPNPEKRQGGFTGSQVDHLENRHSARDSRLYHRSSMWDSLKKTLRSIYSGGSCEDMQEITTKGLHPPRFGPGASTHNHLPYCYPPRHNAGVYAGYHPAPVRMIYESQKLLYSIIGVHQIYVYDRHNHSEALQQVPLPQRGTESPFAYVLQAFNSSVAIVLSTWSSYIVNVKTKEIKEIQQPIPDSQTVPIEFNGQFLLMARNIVDQRSLRVYRTSTDEADGLVEGWLTKPVLILEIPLRKGFIGPSSLWGFDKVLVTIANRLYCYSFNDSAINVYDAKQLFTVNIGAEIRHILGIDPLYTYILTCEAKLWQIDVDGKYIIYDLSPATLQMSYPVRAAIVGGRSSGATSAGEGPDASRFYAFTADNGIFLVALHALR